MSNKEALQLLLDSQKQSGMTRTKFAQAMGVDRTTLWRWQVGMLDIPHWVPAKIKLLKDNGWRHD